MTLPFGCHCDARWGGYRTCHCSGCHKSFTGLTAFDKHRSRGKCRDPESVGLVDAGRNYPCFGLPGQREFDEESAES